jgi:hypothetical protein
MRSAGLPAALGAAKKSCVCRTNSGDSALARRHLKAFDVAYRAQALFASLNATYAERLESRTGARSYMPPMSKAPLQKLGGKPVASAQAARYAPDDKEPVGVAAIFQRLRQTQASARPTCRYIGVRSPAELSWIRFEVQRQWKHALQLQVYAVG